MKTLSLPAILLSLLISQFAHAQPGWNKKRIIREPFLQVFVIDPPHPINWKSPKTLLKSTLQNGLEMDYAPNGHLAVYIKSRKPNKHGVTEILTGMGRTNKMKTLWDTLYKQLGLTAMIHEFGGDLDSAESTNEELHKAFKSGRLSSIKVQLTDASAAKLFGFMENWIQFGSFRHYGGNKSVPKGEGSGCADFAVHFIELAMGGTLPSDDWFSSVYMPYELLQSAPGRKDKKVSALEILRSNVPWAKSEKEGLFFTIPDPEKISKWIFAQSPNDKMARVFPDDYQSMQSINESSKPAFKAPYPRESAQIISDHWKSISVSR